MRPSNLLNTKRARETLTLKEVLKVTAMKRKKAKADLAGEVSNAPNSDHLSHNYLQIAVYINFYFL